MKILRNQHGFSLGIVVVLALVVGLVGLVGYVAYDRFVASDADTQVVEQSAVAEDVEAVATSVPDEITDTRDLDSALTSLDQVTTDETEEDLNIISSELSEF